MAKATALDVQDLSFTPMMHPSLYDGQHMPFKDKSFDTALILTVLHHVADQKTILLEAKRVAKRIIIIEDVHYNTFHKYITFFMDSLFNLEFFGHPHSNRDNTEWRAVFKQYKLKLVEEKAMKSFLVLRHRMYVLDT